METSNPRRWKMIKTFASGPAWRAAAVAAGRHVEVQATHPYPDPADATDPVIAFTQDGDEIGFYDQAGEVGYLADCVEAWDLFTHEGEGAPPDPTDFGQGECSVCGGQCGAAHAMPF
jgi:hypothetical protein